ncbi:unnamed protein product, partial [Closterium sp. NIES-54]
MLHAPVAHAILPALMEHVSYPMSFSPPPLAAASALAGSSHAAAAAAASHGGVPVVSLVSVLAGGGTDVAALTLFVGLLCACIVVGHVLEGVRWINDAVTAILFVSAPSPPLHARPLLRSTITRAVHPRLSPSLASLLRWPPLRFLLTPSVRPFRTVALCVSSSRASGRLRAASSSSPLPPSLSPSTFPSAPGPGVGHGGAVRAGRRELDDSPVRRGPVLHLPAAAHHLQRRVSGEEEAVFPQLRGHHGVRHCRRLHLRLRHHC